MPLAAALQGIIFSQRKGGEFVGQQDAPQVGMAGEANAEHVPHFALHPIGAFPQRHADRTVNSGSFKNVRTINRSLVSVLASI